MRLQVQPDLFLCTEDSTFFFSSLSGLDLSSRFCEQCKVKQNLFGSSFVDQNLRLFVCSSYVKMDHLSVCRSCSFVYWFSQYIAVERLEVLRLTSA